MAFAAVALAFSLVSMSASTAAAQPSQARGPAPSAAARHDDSPHSLMNGSGSLAASGTPVTLTYSATISDQLTCEFTNGADAQECLNDTSYVTSGNQDTTSDYSGGITSSVPITTTDLLQTPGTGTGSEAETVSTLTGSNAFSDTNYTIECVGLDGSSTESYAGTRLPGTMTVDGLQATRNASGDITGLTLSVQEPFSTSSGTDPTEENASVAYNFTGTQCPLLANLGTQHEFYGAIDITAVDQALGANGNDLVLKGWSISPSWTLDVGGELGTKTVTGTTDFSTVPTGIDEPDANTGPITATQTWTVATQPCPAPYEVSGPAWARKFPASREIKDLSNPFRSDVRRFIAAMTAAGIDERTISTLRPYQRAYLMHYAWLIAKRKIDPRKVPAFVPKPGQEKVNICWVHATAAGVPDVAASIAAAEKMLPALGIDPNLKIAPALDSNHTRGQAIDMTTTWTRRRIRIDEANGHRVTIDTRPRDGQNAELIRVGATYGVIHLQPAVKDPNHWSINGR